MTQRGEPEGAGRQHAPPGNRPPSLANDNQQQLPLATTEQLPGRPCIRFSSPPTPTSCCSKNASTSACLLRSENREATPSAACATRCDAVSSPARSKGWKAGGPPAGDNGAGRGQRQQQGFAGGAAVSGRRAALPSVRDASWHLQAGNGWHVRARPAHRPACRAAPLCRPAASPMWWLPPRGRRWLPCSQSACARPAGRGTRPHCVVALRIKSIDLNTLLVEQSTVWGDRSSLPLVLAPHPLQPGLGACSVSTSSSA